ncbi:hypothetical protein GTO89_16560 [Heliobacterium gestii]|uniref:Uncharacterized protein n=1 Tax=Heliomicrobium gestii TaxID=2699 RepID=A0A845LJR9_HELGE|nr:hypothetical protein [Heliomicrobium gestii]MBM7867320.1 hypothetical protein [Heliomicrobium gestii]MZP44635.1 hypothetical protein [Heliomicrobium gestii]
MSKVWKYRSNANGDLLKILVEDGEEVVMKPMTSLELLALGYERLNQEREAREKAAGKQQPTAVPLKEDDSTDSLALIRRGYEESEKKRQNG